MLQHDTKLDLDEKILEYEHSKIREEHTEKKYRMAMGEITELTNKLLENEEDLETIMEKYKTTVDLVSKYQTTIEDLERMSSTKLNVGKWSSNK